MSKTINSYLPARQEWINLIFPLVCLLLVFTEFFLGWKYTGSFLVAISYLGALHHLITIYIIGQSPECLEWSKKYFGGVYKFLIALFIFGALLFVSFIIGMQRLEAQLPIVKWALIIFLFLDANFITTFHMIHQHKGLSLLYNKFGETPENLKSWETWERRCATGLVTGIFMSGFFWNLHRVPLNISEYSFSKPLGYFGMFLVCISAIAYVFIGIRTSLILKSTKGIFSLRMLLWIFYPTSIVAQGAQRLIHGLEYLFTYAKIKASRKDTITYTFIFSALFFIVTYGFILAFRSRYGLAAYFEPGVSHKSLGEYNITILAYSFYGTMNIIHIVLDSFLFRYKFQEARLATLKHLLRRH